MSTDKKPDQAEDSSSHSKEQQVIPGRSKTGEEHPATKGAHMTGLSVKDDKMRNETEGERRFKEGMANNSDSENS